MNNEENEVIDLVEILYAIRQHLLEVILATVVAAIIGFAASKFLMTPQYSSSAMMIVNTRQDVTSNVTSDQINSATKLVATYSIIIKSDTVLQQVIENLGLGITYSELNSRVSVQAVDDTQVMKITVNSTSPEWAQTVCDEILAVSPDIIKEAVEAGFGQGDFESVSEPQSDFPQHKKEHCTWCNGWPCIGAGYYCATGFAGQ